MIGEIKDDEIVPEKEWKRARAFNLATAIRRQLANANYTEKLLTWVDELKRLIEDLRG